MLDLEWVARTRIRIGDTRPVSRKDSYWEDMQNLVDNVLDRLERLEENAASESDDATV